MSSPDYRSLSGPKRLGDRLLEAGLITRSQLDVALEQQQTGGDRRPRLGRTLVELGFLSERDLTQMLGVHLAMPVASFSIAAPDERAIRSITAQLARRHRAIPGRVSGESLLVAVPDPLAAEALEELEAVTRLPVVLHLAPEADIEAALAKYYAEAPDGADTAEHAGARGGQTAVTSSASNPAEHLRELADRLQELARRQEDEALRSSLVEIARELRTSSS